MEPAQTAQAPTPGAMRAAKIMSQAYKLAIMARTAVPTDDLAAMIDKATALPPLLAAVNGIMPLLDAELDAVEPWQQEIAALRAALTKAKGE